MVEKRLIALIFLLMILVAGLISGCQSLPAELPTESDPLEALLEGLDVLPAEEFMAEGFRRLILRSPQTVTEVGLAGFYDVRNTTLDSYDLQERLLTQAFEIELLALARRIDPVGLDEAVQFDLRVFVSYLESRIALHLYQWLDFPLWNETGGLTDQLVEMLMTQQPFADQADVEDYLGRLEAIGPQVDELIGYLSEQQAAGVQIPYALYAEVMEEMGCASLAGGTQDAFHKRSGAPFI